MNTTNQQLQGEENKNQQPGGQEQTSGNVQVSLPKIDRPEGPFEHSGETAGWTKEEKEEKQDMSEENQNSSS